MGKKKERKINPIHIKFEYEEAKSSKKNLLETEKELLILAKIIHQYKLTRSEEFRLKLKLYRWIKNLNTEIRKLQKNLPAIKFAQRTPDKKRIPRTKTKENYYDEKIEKELMEIQTKLNALQAK